MNAQVWLGDRLVDADEARIAYDDHGITVGDGVFETIKVAHGEAFALTRHLQRLERSVSLMGLPPVDEDAVRLGVSQVLAHDGTDGFIRLTITAGQGPLGSNRGEISPQLIIARRPGAVRTDPTGVLLVDWVRNERGALAGVKSTSYGENVVSLATAAKVGCSEALMANTVGQLCEGTGSNVFVGVGDELITPTLASGCLAGVTRALLLEAGVGVERDITIAELDDVTEMFLVSTAREVQPVTHMNKWTFDPCPGPLTVAAADVWNSQIRDQIDP